MRSFVAFSAILITPTTTPHSKMNSWRHHTTFLRDTSPVCFIKEMALLCWLFYLMPWLPLCAPHQERSGHQAEGGRPNWCMRCVGWCGPGWVTEEESLFMGFNCLCLDTAAVTALLSYSSDCQITCTKKQNKTRICSASRPCRWKIDFPFRFV